jgi:acid phosphatase type 7
VSGRTARTVVGLVVVVLATAMTTAPELGPAPRAGVVIGAAGDIACESDPSSDPAECRYDDTADLIDGTGLTKVLLLGDNQYETGSLGAYQTYFDPTWGRVLRRLAPAPGNHEHAQDATSVPRGYFRYFGRRVRGPDGLGYYSFDVPASCVPGEDAVCWHVVSLDSMLCFAPGGCDAPADPADPGNGERMYTWLAADLAAHPNADYPCTIAYWHHPRFSFSTGSGATAVVGPLWDLLYDARADLVLNGHSHNYQRWKPQDPSGRLDRDGGIREFVVGTGGRSHYALPTGDAPANLAAAQDDAFGILRLTLLASGYRWAWASAAGQPSFTDEKAKATSCV